MALNSVQQIATAKPGFSIIKPENIVEIAEKNGVEAAALDAIIQVESTGQPLDSSSRLSVLYEPHIMFKYTTDAKIRGELAKHSLAYPRWGTHPYVTSRDARYKQIQHAADIAGIELALTACSWGSPQIMGFNHKLAGFSSAVEMVSAFSESEVTQIEAMVSFIRANSGMYKALVNKDWAGFALRYNGPGYAKHEYHIRLARSYSKSKLSAKIINPPDKLPKMSVISLGAKGEEVSFVQDRLVAKGIYLNVDGIFGPATRRGVIEFQTKNGLVPDGIVGKKTLTKLLG